jgi:hypothetical protein
MAIEFNNRPTCTACKTEKKETNHWYLLFADDHEEDGPSFSVTTWSNVLAVAADACACGETCAHTLLSRWLETRTFTAPALRSEPGTTQGDH